MCYESVRQKQLVNLGIILQRSYVLGCCTVARYYRVNKFISANYISAFIGKAAFCFACKSIENPSDSVQIVQTMELYFNIFHCWRSKYFCM